MRGIVAFRLGEHDRSFDEILRELAFARMVERGLADSDEGRTISSEEMEARISSWVG